MISINDKPEIKSFLELCFNEYSIKLESEELQQKATNANNTNIALYKDYLAKVNNARVLLEDLYDDSDTNYYMKIDDAVKEVMLHKVNRY